MAIKSLRSTFGLPSVPIGKAVVVIIIIYLMAALILGFFAYKSLFVALADNTRQSTEFPVESIAFTGASALFIYLGIRGWIFRKKLLAEMAYRRGVSALKRGEYKTADQCFRQALSQDSGLWKGHFSLGLSAHRRGDNLKAREHFESGLAIDANQPDLLFALATVLDDLNEVDLALAVLEQLLRVYPKHDNALCLMGCLNERLGRSRNAKELYKQAVAANWRNQAARKNLERL